MSDVLAVLSFSKMLISSSIESSSMNSDGLGLNPSSSDSSTVTNSEGDST